jgi:WD40 repeat protein
VVTCGADRSIKVWNYLTLDLELSKEFEESVESVALHPTGQNNLYNIVEHQLFYFVTWNSGFLER